MNSILPGRDSVAVRQLTLLVTLMVFDVTEVAAQFEFERPPIDYHQRQSNDRVARLKRRIQAGSASIPDGTSRDILRSLLAELQIPESSQLLVFSKTSLQLRQISPSSPRAIYFNEDSYVGWVQGGSVIEILAVDPELGSVFYTLPLTGVDPRRLVRDRGECLSCHATRRTQSVPGLLVRSMYVEASGLPMFDAGSLTSDHRTPLPDRWGGWYVTGNPGTMKHRGNLIGGPDHVRARMNSMDSARRSSLADLVDTTPYLRDSSDLVALMILDHQTQMHNALTRAHYECLSAEHYDRTLNRALNREDVRSESTQRRIRKAGDQLLHFLLFCDEFPLSSKISGDEEFVRDFESTGRKDRHGRSLKDLDLSKRLFRYPCSYLIQSRSFAQLPDSMRDYVLGRLERILSGADPDEQFSHLDRSTRYAIREILDDTSPGLLPAATDPESGQDP